MRKEIESDLRDDLGYARIFKYETFEGVEYMTGCGLVDKENNEVVPCVYDNILGFYNGSPLSVIEKDDKYGYINQELVEVTPLFYDFANDRFYCELAQVKKNGKWGYIDKYGNEIIKCEYDDASIFWENFATVQKDNKWGVINRTGKIVVSFIYDYLSILGKERIFVRSNGKCGLLDYGGRSVVPCIYDGLTNILSNGKIEYKIGAEHGFMNLDGEIIDILPF